MASDEHHVSLPRWKGAGWLVAVSIASVVCLVGGFAVGYYVQADDRGIEANSNRVVPVTAEVVERARSIEPLTARVGDGASVNVYAAVPAGAGAAVITDSRLSIGDVLNECQLLIAVSGAPTFSMRPTTPFYRDLSLGMRGPDVSSLNDSLHRCGLIAEPPGDAYNWVTRIGVAKMFAQAGYVAPGAVAGESLPLAMTVRLATEGMTVTQVSPLNTQVEIGATMLSATAPVQSVTARADVVVAKSIVVGQRASLRLAGSTDELLGTVTLIGEMREADPEVEGSFPGHDITVTLDSSLASTGEKVGQLIIESQGEMETAVPLTAIRTSDGRTYVSVERGDSFVKETVTVTGDGDGWAFVAESPQLHVGDRVLVSP